MIAFRLRERGEVASTNEIVKRAIEAGEPEGFAVLAATQTAGYGRQGRTWASPEGGLYLSMLLRPTAEPRALPTLSLATAIAVRRALAAFVDPDAAGAIQLKWPNDIVVPDAGAGRAFRKLAGLSHELHAGALCVGIGANVVPPTDGTVAADAKNAPVFLRELPGAANASPAAVAAAVLSDCAAVYDAWQRSGIASLLSEYNSHSFLAGRTVRLAGLDGAVVCEGVARAVDEDGRLVVETAQGARRVSSGEAHVL